MQYIVFWGPQSPGMGGVKPPRPALVVPNNGSHGQIKISGFS